MNNTKGLTLIELVIVIAIINIMAFIAIPNISMIDRINIKNTANEFREDVLLTKHLALNTGVPCKIIMFRDKYVIKKYNDTYKVVKLDDVEIKNNYPYSSIVFNNRGNVNKAGTIVLNSSKYTCDITLRVATGYVSIKNIKNRK